MNWPSPDSISLVLLGERHVDSFVHMCCWTWDLAPHHSKANIWKLMRGGKEISFIQDLSPWKSEGTVTFAAPSSETLGPDKIFHRQRKEIPRGNRQEGQKLGDIFVLSDMCLCLLPSSQSNVASGTLSFASRYTKLINNNKYYNSLTHSVFIWSSPDVLGAVNLGKSRLLSTYHLIWSVKLDNKHLMRARSVDQSRNCLITSVMMYTFYPSTQETKTVGSLWAPG